jgi:branched-chain amino acid transport system substrate-binding protein
MPTKLTRRQALAIPAGLALGSLAPRAAGAADPIKVGLVAALSGQSAKSGEGITRGLTIAIDEINAHGGVLGRRRPTLRATVPTRTMCSASPLSTRWSIAR